MQAGAAGAEFAYMLELSGVERDGERMTELLIQHWQMGTFRGVDDD